MNKNPQKLPLSYYFNWQGLESFDYYFDENGIPLVDYGSEIGLRYNAITTAQYGLYNLQQFEAENKKQYSQVALQCADWLIDNLQGFHSIHAWIFDFDLDF